MKKMMILSVTFAFIANGLIAQLPTPIVHKLYAKRSFHDCTRNFIDNSLAKQSCFNFEQELPMKATTPADNVGVWQNDLENNVTVCNPVYGTISIRSASDIIITKVEVYDILGKLQLDAAANDSNIQMPADRLKSGMYFIRIYNELHSFTTVQIYKV
jgi:hypothetical protein